MVGCCCCCCCDVQATGNPPLTIESVTAALEDVRPYLLADGGDVIVQDVNVQTGVVMVELQGACSSCASSRWGDRRGLTGRRGGGGGGGLGGGGVLTGF
jgi:Fe-S cluster biogenesis protein NfuA